MNSIRQTNTVLYFQPGQKRAKPLEKMTDNIFRYARAKRWHLQDLIAPRDAKDMRHLLSEWNPIGCIVNVEANGPAMYGSSLKGIPTVFLHASDTDESDCAHPHSFLVCHDAQSVINLAARHFLELGFVHFAFIGYSSPWRWSKARCELFKAAVSGRASSFKSFTFNPLHATPLIKYRDFLRWLGTLSKPCAILLANDALASLLYPACSQAKLSIPDDISVIGVDDDERFCANLTPPLSSIRVDTEKAGWLAAEMLNRQIDIPGLKPYSKTYSAICLVPRQSTKRPASIPPPTVTKLKEKISRFACNSSANDIVKGFGQCRKTLEQQFLHGTGMSLHDAIRETRLNHAKTLLAQSNVQLSKIPLMCGYKSRTTFIGEFQRQFEVSMHEYRNQILTCKRQMPTPH